MSEAPAEQDPIRGMFRVPFYEVKPNFNYRVGYWAEKTPQSSTRQAIQPLER
jgi:hypothetical protein